MNKIKYLIFIITLILFPVRVLAAGNVTVNKSSIVIEQGGKGSFNVTASNAAGRVIISSSNNGIVTVDKTNEWVENQTITVNVTGITPGNSTININVNAATFDEEVITKTYTINVTVNSPKSSNNKLSSIKVDGKSYNISDTIDIGSTNNNTINITATAADSKATISGIGTKNLNYGRNTFNIVVTAENGSKKTYTITVNKNDPRSANNNLKSLSLSKGTIEFNKNTTSYTIKYEHDINDITITAAAEDTKAKVSGTGNKKLNDYSNEFKITVTAENGSTKTYIIKAIRKDSSGNYGKLDTDNSVKSIIIKDVDFKFNEDTKKYNILVDNIDQLDITVIPTSSLSNVLIENNEKLKPGLNKVTVKITAENGDINEYIFNVYKISEQENTTSEKCNIVEKETKKTNIWLIISIIEFIILTTILILYIKKIARKDKSYVY